MDIEKEREAFEAWYRKEYDNTVIDDSEFSEILDEYESNYYWVDELNQSWKAWQTAKAQAVPEGFVLVPKEPTPKMIDSTWDYFEDIEGMSHNKRNEFIYKAMIDEAQEPQITELKVEWASDCFKCGHHEAIIYSTAAEASTKGWFHDGDEAKCTGCGNTGEMDAQGEDSGILWNEDEEAAKNA